MPEYEPRATHRRADRVSSASTSHDRWRRRRGVFPRLSGVTKDFFIVIDRRERPARDGGRSRGGRSIDQNRALSRVLSTCALRRALGREDRRSLGGEHQNRRASGPTDMRARSATGDAEGECGARRASSSPSPSTETRATAETGGRFGRGVVRERRRRANADANANATRADDDGRGAMTTTTNRFRDVFRVDDGAGGGDGGGGEDPPARFPASVAPTNADGDAARDCRAMSAREWQETAKRMMRNQPTVLRRAGATGDETGVSATTATATARRADTFEGLTTMWSDFERTASRFGTRSGSV